MRFRWLRRSDATVPTSIAIASRPKPTPGKLQSDLTPERLHSIIRGRLQPNGLISTGLTVTVRLNSNQRLVRITRLDFNMARQTWRICLLANGQHIWCDPGFEMTPELLEAGRRWRARAIRSGSLPISVRSDRELISTSTP